MFVIFKKRFHICTPKHKGTNNRTNILRKSQYTSHLCLYRFPQIGKFYSNRDFKRNVRKQIFELANEPNIAIKNK
jgi:hypothetical protein